MLDNIRPDEVLFLDIETVPQQEIYDNLDDSFKKLWDKKSKQFRKEDEPSSNVYQRAGIYAEFGKIVCISVGYIYMVENQHHFRTKSFFGTDEREILKTFLEMLNGFVGRKNIQLCAHNGKEFDFPYIARRVLINGLPLPKILDVAGKKPWETNFLDTLELWKFGDYKSYTSLELLTKVFNIPTPKDDIDGSQVAHVFYIEKNVKRIAIYCEKDVIAIAQLFLRFKGEEIMPPENCHSLIDFN
jgi:3'-5' exonuclease